MFPRISRLGRRYRKVKTLTLTRYVLKIIPLLQLIMVCNICIYTAAECAQ